MADVITRFKLETTQYDSKLRDEAKRLAEFTRQCSMAGSEFGRFSQKNVEAARALGNIAPSANNAKDKVKELVGAFNDWAKAYNALTKEQQQSDFGKAMAESIGKLNVKIREAKQELYGMGDAMKKAGSGGLFGGDKMSGMLQVFGGNMMTKTATFAKDAVSSFASEIGDAVKQGIELAKQGEGIRIAFERLGRGDILQGLREATHGTVTDLELMKAAVKFNDFKLPLDQLGTMLAFAQQKAKDTGQSVDAMVESIVTGLGRKSLMILDNLGLSAAEIKEKMKETGDMTKAVGEIIREQMAKAGDYVETAADRAAQANTSLLNKMDELGRKYLPLQEASDTFWTSVKISILDIVGGPLADFLNGLTEAGRRMNMLKNMNDSGEGQPSKVDRQLMALGGSNFKQQRYNAALNWYDHEIKVAEYYKKKYEKTGWAGGGLVLGEASKRFGVMVHSKEDIDNIIDSLRVMRSDYAKRGANILNPLKDNNNNNNNNNNNPANTSKTTTTHKTTPQEKAAELVLKAERNRAETIEKAAIRLRSGIDTELDYKKKELALQEKLFDAYGEAYTIYQSAEYKKKQEEAAAAMGKLAEEIKATTTAQADMKSTISAVNKSTEKSMNDRIQKFEKSLEWRTFNEKGMQALSGELNDRQSKAVYGSEAYKKTRTNITDLNTLQSIIEFQTRNNLQIDTKATSGLFSQIAEGKDIGDEFWKEFIKGINNSLTKGTNPLKINLKTGEEGETPSTIVKTLTEISNTLSEIGGNVSSIVGGLNQMGIKTPDWLNKVLGFVGGAGRIASGVVGLAGMFGFSNGGIVPHAQNGLAVVPGTHFSGDVTPILANAGEVVLTHSQVSNLAASLTNRNSDGGYIGTASIQGEQIFITLNNYLRRRGYGELLTTR